MFQKKLFALVTDTPKNDLKYNKNRTTQAPYRADRQHITAYPSKTSTKMSLNFMEFNPAFNLQTDFTRETLPTDFETTSYPSQLLRVFDYILENE